MRIMSHIDPRNDTQAVTLHLSSDELRWLDSLLQHSLTLVPATPTERAFRRTLAGHFAGYVATMDSPPGPHLADYVAPRAMEFAADRARLTVEPRKTTAEEWVQWAERNPAATACIPPAKQALIAQYLLDPDRNDLLVDGNDLGDPRTLPLDRTDLTD